MSESSSPRVDRAGNRPAVDPATSTTLQSASDVENEVIVVNLLLVDDEPANLIALEALLQPLGHRLVRARSGREAVELARDTDFAAVLLDVNMPLMDGYQTALRIREGSHGQRVPILFVTAGDDGPEAQARGYAVGAVEFLAKPIDTVALRAKVALLVELYVAKERARRRAVLETRERAARERQNEVQRFVAEASGLLASSLDWETTLANVTRLAVPRMGDWCGVDIIEPNGDVRQLAVAHVDPEKVAYAHRLREKYPPNPADVHGLYGVIKTGRSELIAEVTDELLAASVKDAEQLEVIRTLGLRSWLVVPLVTHGKILGALSLVRSETGSPYGPADLALAEDLAQRAAIAVENARLFAEVRELNASLEKRVEERTVQLTEANKELEAFSYTVSHDLRAPIRHMSGFVDLLDRHAGATLDDKSKRYVRIIGDSAKQMGSLIDALLAFSRIGRAELARVRVDLAGVFADVRQSLEPDLVGRNVVWNVDPLPAVDGDPTLLRLVLGNLVGNAVKYTRGRPEAAIAIGAQPSTDGREIVMSVRDNGVGFNPAYTHKLFGVFQRLHTDAQFEGTGIGLANVKRIVQRHGGRVWAEGAPEAGATFYFTLPVPSSERRVS